MDDENTCQSLPLPEPSAMIRAVRGATTLSEDSVASHTEAVVQLISELIEFNDIQPDDILSAFFTVTADLRAISPAKIARTHFPWDAVPMVCAREPEIDGLPERCVRILIQFETERPRAALRHAYHNQAASLRPDLLG